MKIFFLKLQEQLISQLKELLSEIGHKVNNGCGATPLSPSSAQENQNVSISETKEEPMELQEDNKMEPSTSADQGDGVGPSGRGSSMDTDGSDDKQIIDCAAGPSCSSSPTVHGNGDTLASSSNGEGGSFSEKVITVLYIRSKGNKIYIIPIHVQ